MTKPEEKQAFYPTVEANPDFAALELEILAFWKREGIFQQSVDKNKGTGAQYVFYDGPPFANGSPHYGHLLTGYVKDLVARYQTMRGKRVERRFGWDCHGLPAEMGAEKDLGISGRQAIMEYGIGKFNDHCRESVMKYASEWERYVDRQGRWVDFANDYKTMDKDFMESVLWAFSELYKKGLIYESYRVMPYSWAAETPLSNFETRLDNATREREDKAITVAFELDEVPQVLRDWYPTLNLEKCYILAWTTTPWTLPSNLALAVGDVQYCCEVRDGIGYIMAESYSCVFGHNEEGAPLFTKKALIGLTYKPLFPYFAHLKHTQSSSSAESSSPRLRGEVRRGEFGKAPDSTRHLDAMDHAHELRKNPTEAEKKLWDMLRGKQMEGCKFRRQQAIGHYIVDFVCMEKGLVIEADGGQHDQQASYDAERTAFLEEAGYRVLRFWNNEILENPEGVYQRISEYLDSPTPTLPRKQGRESLGAFRILDGSDFIEEGSGTGVVHLAPGFGEDDQKCCEANGISIVCPVDDKGCYTEEVFDIEVSGVRCQVSGSEDTGTRNPKPETLRLKGLNVIADTRKSDDEPYKEDQLKKYGLANLRIINWLKQNGQLIKQEDFKHNYPHCWRTDTPIIYRALPSWYVKVTAFKDRAVALNQNIHWIPEHTRDGAMGHMLASAPDWSISRNRFWGCPIPVWKSPSGKIKVFGSIAELEAASGQKITDLHRPFIDEIIIREDGEEYRRVEEVLDCWFESGSMPYAQLHYPFENAEKFKANYPGDFITEYIGQTRGWFNTLIMLATALFDEEPFKNCICHGVVIDEETGLKYSKRLKNYKDPMEVFDTFGADALRWLMVSSGVMRGHDLGVDPEGKFIRDVVRLNIKPIWNAYNFFTLYANADIEAGLIVKAEFNTGSLNEMDRYILEKCRMMVLGIQVELDDYDTPGACEAVTKFVEVLNNWYIRRSRPRFWESGKTADKQAAYNTLYTVLHTLCRAAAPLLPFTLEAVFRGLTENTSHRLRGEDGRGAFSSSAQAVTPPPQPSPASGGGSNSVHLQDFPKELANIEGVYLGWIDMDRVRDICNAALSVRNSANIRTRQPLSLLTIYSGHELGWGIEKSDYFKQIVMDELNVKGVVFSRNLDSVASKCLSVNSRRVGKRLPEKMKQILPSSKKGEWKLLETNTEGFAVKVEVAGVELENFYCCDEDGELLNEFEIKLESKIKAGAAPLSTNDALVVLDLTLTPELIAEGLARDVVRMVQESRKKADLHISDKISLIITAPDAVQQAVSGFTDYIAGQVLAESVAVGSSAGDFSFEHELEGEKVVISFSKVSGSGFQVSGEERAGTRHPTPETSAVAGQRP